MQKDQRFIQLFEQQRSQLQAIAYRILGSQVEAEDAVQEAWLRLNSTDINDVKNLGGWLTTVISHISLNILRARGAKPERSLEDCLLAPELRETERGNPEQEVLLADSIGLALLVILDTLSPHERLAFMLHDIFGVPFAEIGQILQREVAATRQLASRARRRIRAGAPLQDASLTASSEVIDAFLTASREGSFEALLALLDPDIVYHGSARKGIPQILRGAKAVARQIGRSKQFARFIQPLMVNDTIGIVVAPYKRLIFMARFKMKDGKITEIHVITDPSLLSQLNISIHTL